ncbi:M57 family metalloprotease [Aquimarina sp. RZ0]|uniref:M57 family metalloprotease n=1 Tax=Aquimarina sp. RZ0 TaxID=2607730 RepID=UPI0011F2D918|nr:M57 family metalloprotease [Aquimarina sp. RZ0]KAA1239845.1 peptidase [Aquimarina sp. RZ0]
MKKIKFLAFYAIVAGFATSCQKDDVANEVQSETITESVSKEHLEGLAKAGVNPTGASYVTISHLGEAPVEYVKSGDILVALDKMAEQALPTNTENNVKQYVTRNLVNANTIVRVTGWTGGGNALTSRMRTGLERAIRNYNDLDLRLKFELTFGTDQSSRVDMVIYNAGGSGQGGQAEFPSGGRSGKYIQIFGGMASASNDVNEHVIGHEMGHALGFRHTDYARRRCDGSNEGQANIGALSIPGTPSANQWGQRGLDTDSIMISCFNGNEDGEFSRFDIIALRYIY